MGARRALGSLLLAVIQSCSSGGGSGAPAAGTPQPDGASCTSHSGCMSGACYGSVCEPAGAPGQHCNHYKCAGGDCAKCNPGFECVNDSCTPTCTTDTECSPGICNQGLCDQPCDPANPPTGTACVDGHATNCSELPSSYCSTCGCKPGYTCTGTGCEFAQPQLPSDTRLLPLEAFREWTYEVTPAGEGGNTVVIGEFENDEWPAGWFGTGISFTVGSDPDQVAAYFPAYEWQFSDTPVTAGHNWNAGFGDGTMLVWSDEGTVTVPAGTFADCWTATFSYAPSGDYTLCRGAGLVRDTGGGRTAVLVKANFLPGQGRY